MIDSFIIYFPPQFTSDNSLSTWKDIRLFSKTPSTQLLDTPPFCVDTERIATRHLIGQNMIVIDWLKLHK